MKKAAVQSGYVSFQEKYITEVIHLKVFIFDEAGNRLVTCNGWKEAEASIRELQEQGHNVLVAKDYEKERHTPATSGRQLPVSFIFELWPDKALIGPTYLRRDEQGRG